MNVLDPSTLTRQFWRFKAASNYQTNRSEHAMRCSNEFGLQWTNREVLCSNLNTDSTHAPKTYWTWKVSYEKKSTPDQYSSWIKRITLINEPSVFLRKVVKGLAYRQCQLYFAHPSTRCLGPNQQSPPHHKMPKQFRKVKTSYHTLLEMDIDR